MFIAGLQRVLLQTEELEEVILYEVPTESEEGEEG